MVSERVIVIGAGLAGLAAARSLRDRGYAVVVLEARKRSGGRILTKYCVDVGAQWIYGTEGNPITNLARQHALDTVFVGGDSTYRGGWEAIELYRERLGRVNSEEKWQSILVADRLRDTIEGLRREAIRLGRPDFSVAQAVAEAQARLRGDDRSNSDLPWHVALFAREDCAAPPDSLSTLFWDEGYEVYGYGDSVFVDGYGSLISKLETGLDIRFQEVVTSIEYSPDPIGRVLVRTREGEHRAHRVIVTVPLGVLKKSGIRFSPALNEFRVRAIDRLGFGVLGKIFFFFKDVFWNKDQYIFGYVSQDTSFEPTHIINLWKTQHVPCLQIQAGGALGKWLEECSTADAETWATRTLEACFGHKIPAPTRVLRSSWSVDEFSMGAYTYMKVGSRPEDTRTLSEPVGDWLYFAGEATNPFQWGSTHGAYTSGLREASRITGDASILPVRHFSENRRWREMMLRSSRFFNQQMRLLDEPSMRKRIQILANSDVFRTVPGNELRLLAAMFEEKRYAKGDVVCKTGDKAEEVFVIAEGALEIWLPNARKATEIVSVRTVVGEYGMFTDARRNATLIAAEPTTLLSLDYNRFERFLLAFPESTIKLFKHTVQKFMAQQQTLLTNTAIKKSGTP
ncbi:MAG TPA: FAD-dependent oxidoreductase [Terriglobia bacterium]|jgi:monoamine oxidase